MCYSVAASDAGSLPSSKWRVHNDLHSRSPKASTWYAICEVLSCNGVGYNQKGKLESMPNEPEARIRVRHLSTVASIAGGFAVLGGVGVALLSPGCFFPNLEVCLGSVGGLGLLLGAYMRNLSVRRMNNADIDQTKSAAGGSL